MKKGDYLIAKIDVTREIFKITRNKKTNQILKSSLVDSYIFKKDKKYYISNVSDTLVEILYDENKKIVFSLSTDVIHFEYYQNIFY